MHFFILIVVLGPYLVRGVSLQQRNLGPEDSSNVFWDVESDIIERDGEFFAAQHPLAQPDENLDEKTLINPTLNTVDHAIDKIEPFTVQNPRSEDFYSDIHSVVKRFPGFITFTERFSTSVTVRSGISVPVPFTQAVGEIVTVTDKDSGPRTVTARPIAIRTITQVFTESGTVYQVTVPPASATEEFFTSVYLAESFTTTVTIRVGIAVPFTVTKPGPLTITERVSTVTVTETFNITRSILQTTFIPIATQTIVIPGCPCPVPTTDSQ